MQSGQLHHIEYYVDDLGRTEKFWGWFLPLIGWSFRSKWPKGIDWAHANGTYIVFALTEPEHRGKRNNRQAAGLNHLAFRFEPSLAKDDLVSQLVAHGARLIYDEPGYLCFEEQNGFAVELYLN